jgi:hypothetical protein
MLGCVSRRPSSPSLEERVRIYRTELDRLRKQHRVRPGAPGKAEKRTASIDDLAGLAAKEAGLGSRSTAQLAVKLVDSRASKLVARINAGRLTINAAYKLLRTQAEQPPAETEPVSAEEGYQEEMMKKGFFHVGENWYRRLGNIEVPNPGRPGEDFVALDDVLALIPAGLDPSRIRIVGNREGVQAYEKLPGKPDVDSSTE